MIALRTPACVAFKARLKGGRRNIGPDVDDTPPPALVVAITSFMLHKMGSGIAAPKDATGLSSPLRLLQMIFLDRLRALTTSGLIWHVGSDGTENQLQYFALTITKAAHLANCDPRNTLRLHRSAIKSDSVLAIHSSISHINAS